MSLFDIESMDQFRFLQSFGFDSFFSEQCTSGELAAGHVARVIHEEKNLLRIQCSEHTLRWAEISGRFYFDVRSSLDLPSVGDWVIYCPLEGSDRAVVHRVLKRRTCLYRTAVGGGNEEQILGSNVDTAFVMTSLNQDLNFKRLERYFVLCVDSGVQLVLILTKLDLIPPEGLAMLLKTLEKTYPTLAVAAVSVKTGEGMETLTQYIKTGKTIALLGSSGVGKSSLTNYLMGNELLATKAVRESDDKGRHTTTGRHLCVLPDGGLMMDTPGMRELQLFQHQEGLSEVFDDIEAMKAKCKFSNCSHDTEPGCAIQNAIAEGGISDGRWNNYLKLLRELAFQAKKLDKAAQSADKQRWKKQAMALRRTAKHR